MQDWGEAPESGVFYGRTEELATLEQWIVKDRLSPSYAAGNGGNWQNCLGCQVG
jgi:hypothetical protein